LRLSTFIKEFCDDDDDDDDDEKGAHRRGSLSVAKFGAFTLN